MKQLSLFLIALFIFNTSISQQLVVDDKGKEKLLGTITQQDLKQHSFKDWFVSEFDQYQPHKTIIKDFKKELHQYKIKVFLGTWCGDSKREVPRFMKILKQAKFPKSQVQIIALDKTKEAYKQSPGNEEKGLNIHRVPTFIFYKDGKEVNRIVEEPTSSFERDIAIITSTNKYQRSYRVVPYLEAQIQEFGIDALRKKKEELLPVLAEFSKGSRELNTYGYVKLRANQTKEALFIFEVNNTIYPCINNTYSSLGEAYFISGQFNKAKKCYKHILTKDHTNEDALAMLEKIQHKMN